LLDRSPQVPEFRTHIDKAFPPISTLTHRSLSAAARTVPSLGLQAVRRPTAIAAEVLWLPTSPELRADERAAIVALVHDAIAAARAPGP
jgi:hypothetical protein